MGVLAGAVVAASAASPTDAPARVAPASIALVATLAIVAAVVAAALVALLLRRATAGLPSPVAPTGRAATLFDNAAGVAGGAGAALLASQVVPVWQRQLEASRSEAEQGLGGLLESFNQLNSGLSHAVAAAGQGHERSLGAGAADDLVDRHQHLIDQLLEPVQALRDARDQVQAELKLLSELMLTFQRGSKDLAVLARHGRLVAMNASIEANRAGQAQSGFGAVAREVLELSNKTGGSAEHLLQRLGEAERRLGALRGRLELDTSNAETLSLELRQRARAIVSAMVSDVGSALAGSRELRESGQSLQSALDGVFVGFQFQDRFAQMLGSVLTDMSRFTEWLGEGRTASHADAVAWLKRLDESYTMEQQRSHHHGTGQISKSPAVEFF
jgi:methyl-accepting chemotaxis protein